MKIIIDNPLIKTKCKQVDLKEGRKIAKRMTLFIYAHNKKNKIKAAGIAANQLGINASVAVAMIKGRPLILINPVIIDFSRSKFAQEEQCLSFPDQILTVFRHDWIIIKSDNFKETMFFGQNPNSDIDHKSLFETSLVQHEISHLFGKTIHDFQWENSPSPKEW